MCDLPPKYQPNHLELCCSSDIKFTMETSGTSLPSGIGPNNQSSEPEAPIGWQPLPSPWRMSSSSTTTPNSTNQIWRHNPPATPSYRSQNPSAIRRECKFCRNNGEASETFSSHTLRCPRTRQLICPVLRSYVCGICGATGDNAHTHNYCPQLRTDAQVRPCLPALLNQTARQANGRR